jgi:hypothetical protein
MLDEKSRGQPGVITRETSPAPAGGGLSGDPRLETYGASLPYCVTCACRLPAFAGMTNSTLMEGRNDLR